MDRLDDNLLQQIIAPRAEPIPRADAAVCDDCGSDAVGLAACTEHTAGEWRVLLRCGRCGKWQALVINQAAADRLDAALDAGLWAIAGDLEALDRQRMAAQVEAFAVAMDRDLIDPEDFAFPG